MAQRLRIRLQMQEDKGSILGLKDRTCHGAAKPVLPNYWGCALELLLLLLLSRFSRVRLCATPQTAAHQAPPSLGFSRQEHWSGWPFPFFNGQSSYSFSKKPLWCHWFSLFRFTDLSSFFCCHDPLLLFPSLPLL